MVRTYFNARLWCFVSVILVGLPLHSASSQDHTGYTGVGCMRDIRDSRFDRDFVSFWPFLQQQDVVQTWSCPIARTDFSAGMDDVSVIPYVRDIAVFESVTECCVAGFSRAGGVADADCLQTTNQSGNFVDELIVTTALQDEAQYMLTCEIMGNPAARGRTAVLSSSVQEF